MTAIEIARQLAGYGSAEQACNAYMLAIHENNGEDPAQDMEAALYILQSGGDYKVSYTCFQRLYNRGQFQEDCLSVMTQAFYEPNVKALRSRYERNCKLLRKYPYLFREDFLPFEELPIKFYPFDDKSYTPFDTREKRFGDYINFNRPVISRNFFKDLENPILAAEVFSQYELEYLNDNVRKSEHIGRENHIYLHYADWGTFCSYLQCLNLRRLLEDKKFVFLIGEEIGQYPLDFKERFGLDYSHRSVKPLGIRDIHRLIWHTQLATHNGGDFFNEIFDNHPNLLAMPSMMFSNMEESVEKIRAVLDAAPSARVAAKSLPKWEQRIVDELYLLRDRTDKDILVSMFFSEQGYAACVDAGSRIAPAVFFQPHFPNMVYSLKEDYARRVTIYSDQYEQIRVSPLFRNFKYIKTFTPMRRPTTSHGATVKFMFNRAMESGREGKKKSVVSDAVSERVLNRSFMIDWQDRLYADSVLVRFEDSKLNPKATFTALAAFLDLPWTESMTYCSCKGERDPESLAGNDLGFSTAAIYRTYDDYVNDDERYFLEYFLRDAYEYYGYDFVAYDGKPMDEQRAKELIDGFTTINRYINQTWRTNVFGGAKATDGEAADETGLKKAIDQAMEKQLSEINQNRLRNARFLLRGLRFVNKNGQPLHMMPKLELDPELLEQPLYR